MGLEPRVFLSYVDIILFIYIYIVIDILIHYIYNIYIYIILEYTDIESLTFTNNMG